MEPSIHFTEFKEKKKPNIVACLADTFELRRKGREFKMRERERKKGRKEGREAGRMAGRQVGRHASQIKSHQSQGAGKGEESHTVLDRGQGWLTSGPRCAEGALWSPGN